MKYLQSNNDRFYNLLGKLRIDLENELDVEIDKSLGDSNKIIIENVVMLMLLNSLRRPLNRILSNRIRGNLLTL